MGYLCRTLGLTSDEGSADVSWTMISTDFGTLSNATYNGFLFSFDSGRGV